jgi:hypothetical protein
MEANTDNIIFYTPPSVAPDIFIKEVKIQQQSG